MSDISFTCEWLSAGQDAPELRDTTARFTLRVGGVSLTQNEDVWSKTVRDSVLLSAYPLATWLAASWWRLNYEPLPKHGVTPTVDWRMGHEIGAANHGFVWPRIVLAPDGEAIQVWAAPSSPSGIQSVRYLTGLEAPRSIPAQNFQHAVDQFIGTVLSRLHAMGHPDTELAALWNLVREDRASPETLKERSIEAQMGYDPQECPPEVMAEALRLDAQMGAAALAELAPVFGGASLGKISDLASTVGLQGKPEIPHVNVLSSAQPPWQRAVETAGRLRQATGIGGEPIDDVSLYGFLGLKAKAVDAWEPPPRPAAGLAVPTTHEGLKYVPRKRHPRAKRFEFARFLADLLNSDAKVPRWLTTTDLATSRQKFQRAFAAEFLCPIHSLVSFLGGDFSEAAVEDAGTHFGVSDQTVESLLANNGYIAPRAVIDSLPYNATA